LIEGLVTRIRNEYGQPMTVIATGGLAALFHKQVAVIDHLNRDLTISGLILVHARNKDRPRTQSSAS
jgi:type III pantothenate kinase